MGEIEKNYKNYKFLEFVFFTAKVFCQEATKAEILATNCTNEHE